MKKCPNCNSEISDDSRFCPVCGKQLSVCPQCGTDIAPGARFCPTCGKNLTDTSAPVNNGSYSSTYTDDTKTRERALLNEQYSRRASNSFVLSIVSFCLCCCSIIAIISLILSILVLVDMSKMSTEIKLSEEYRKVKNKAVIALVISGIIVFMSISGLIVQIMSGAYSEGSFISSSYTEVGGSSVVTPLTPYE